MAWLSTWVTTGAWNQPRLFLPFAAVAGLVVSEGEPDSDGFQLESGVVCSEGGTPHDETTVILRRTVAPSPISEPRAFPSRRIDYRRAAVPLQNTPIWRQGMPDRVPRGPHLKPFETRVFRKWAAENGTKPVGRPLSALDLILRHNPGPYAAGRTK